MADGQSLEKAGVAPDVIALPRGADLAAGRDPVMRRAVGLVGPSSSLSKPGGSSRISAWTDRTSEFEAIKNNL